MATLDTYNPDKLIAGNMQVQTEEVVILSGQGVLSRAAVLGQVAAGAVPATGTADGGNTGDGTMTAVAGKRRIKVGVYTARCIAAAADGGAFEILSPSGEVLGVANVGIAFVSDEIDLLINDGAADYVVGDKFTVTVPAGSGKYVLVDKDNIDGSGVAKRILSEDVDATSADVTTIGYKTGQFNEAALSFAAGDDADDHRDDLRVEDIHLVTVQAA